MTWKTKYRSIYYEGAPEPEDFNLIPEETALLVIDIQNTYLERLDRESMEDVCPNCMSHKRRT